MSASTHPNTIIWSPAGASRLAPSSARPAGLGRAGGPQPPPLCCPFSRPAGLVAAWRGGPGTLVERWVAGGGRARAHGDVRPAVALLGDLSGRPCATLGFERVTVVPESARGLLRVLALTESEVVGSSQGLPPSPGYHSRGGGRPRRPWVPMPAEGPRLCPQTCVSAPLGFPGPAKLKQRRLLSKVRE